MISTLLPALVLLLQVSASVPTAKPAATNHPAELGTVSWQRDFPLAQANAVQLGRPILLLFQEVPG